MLGPATPLRIGSGTCYHTEDAYDDGDSREDSDERDASRCVGPVLSRIIFSLSCLSFRFGRAASSFYLFSFRCLSSSEKAAFLRHLNLSPNKEVQVIMIALLSKWKAIRIVTA